MGKFYYCILKNMNSSASTSETSENVYLRFYFILVSFGVCVHVQYFSNAVRNKTWNKKYLLKLIKRRSNVHEKNKSHERRALSFDQWKWFYENYKPMVRWKNRWE